MLAGALVAGLLGGAPAANAVFTRTLNAGIMPVTAYKLASPTGNNVTVLCQATGQSGKSKMTITVNSHGTVAKANNYVLTVKDSAGVVTTTDLSLGNTFGPTSPGSNWNYSVDARYKVPGKSYFWSSDLNFIPAC